MILDYLTGLIGRMGHWGYLVMFVAAALESAAFLGLFIPGESLVLLAGFLASRGFLDLDVAIWTITFGAIAGDSLGYELGRRLDRANLLHYGHHVGLRKERIDKADAFFQRHGGKSVFLGRFIGFARAIVPFLAGTSRMPYRVFMRFNVLGAAIWSSALVSLGYVLGAGWRHAERWVGAASLILGGFFLLFLALVWIHHIAVRHEKQLQQRWQRILRSSRMRRLRRRISPAISFIRARMSPHGYFSARLAAGAIVLLAAGWLFGGIAEDVATNDPLTKFDVTLAQWLHVQATAGMAQVMLGVGKLTGPLAIAIYVAGFALYLFSKRSWYWLASLVVTVPCGMLVNTLMKLAFHRARPNLEHPIQSLASYSFPSGHAAGATLFFGILASFIVCRTRAWSWRVAACLAAVTAVLVVSFSRMYLGVHYLSDVLAAMAEGVAWLALCLTGMHTYRTSHESTKAHAPACEALRRQSGSERLSEDRK